MVPDKIPKARKGKSEVALGLDISTSIVGWSVVPTRATVRTKPIAWGHFHLKKLKDFWDKVDQTEQGLSELLCDLDKKGYTLKYVFVEDIIKRFNKRQSSAHTITLLAKFNCVVTYIARQRSKITPIYIGATDARNAIGIPLKSKRKADGTTHKEQAFSYLSEKVFRKEKWPRTPKGNVKDYCYDRMDSYVVALAGVLTNG